jgi:hypothetical protein
MLLIRLPEDFDERLCLPGRAAGLGESHHVVYVFLAHTVDVEDLRITETGLKHVCAGHSMNIPLEETRT